MDENILYQNINNLTTLWKEAVTPNGKYTFENKLHLAVCHNSEWPNRLWSNDFLNENLLNNAVDLIEETIENINLSIFLPLNKGNNTDIQNLQNDGHFITLSKQYGMFLELKEFDFKDSVIKFHKVTNEKDALVWEENFKATFNYRIISDQILLSFKGYNCFLIMIKNQIIGCCMCLALNSEYIGFHSFAIHPKFQRKGLGTITMKAFLNESVKNGFKYIVLQSSEKGHILYKQLGFNDQFLMLNLGLQSNE